MDDFNRVKIIFTTQQLVDFIDTSLKNYYAMFNNVEEFEDYIKHSDAEMYIVNVDNQNHVKPSFTPVPDVNGKIRHPFSDLTNE